MRERHYDEIFDAQRHFRVVLDSMARPGLTRAFPALSLTPPAPLSPAGAAVALSLLDANVTHSGPAFGEAALDYLRVNTSSRPAPAAEADFLFLAPGLADPAVILSAKPGLPAYPEQAATLVIETNAIEPGDASGLNGTDGWLRISVQGPGVDGTAHFHVQGVDTSLLEAILTMNREYPLGLDSILTAGDRIVGLPRSTVFVWE